MKFNLIQLFMRRTKKCSVSGMRYPLKEFYRNDNYSDGLHPYAKKYDNFRRKTGFKTAEMRELINLTT
jgi:hypothetical protein